MFIVQTRRRQWGTVELLEGTKVAAVLTCLRNERSAARVSATSFAAAPTVANQNHTVPASGPF